jgi:DNA-binding transcriptional MerR regulator/mannose-6-phosphate isomerase-like protein (cupin superfamily)
LQATTTSRLTTPKANVATRESIAESAMKVGAVAQRLGVSPSWVRGWERLGLCTPERTKGKYRLYTIEDLRVLRRAAYLRKVEGLNTAAILKELKQKGQFQSPFIRTEEAYSLGSRLRALRLQRGESLSKVSDAVGVSKGFLSNLEKSKNVTSGGVLRKLSRYYGLSFSKLRSLTDGIGPQVRPNERREVEAGPGFQVELLACGKVAMEPHLFRITPGAGSLELFSHEGEEFLYVIRGRLDIQLNGNVYHLASGDSFYFSSKSEHRWCNPGKIKTIVLWLNTRATF